MSKGKRHYGYLFDHLEWRSNGQLEWLRMLDRQTRVYGDDRCWRCLSERMVSGPFEGRLKYLCRKCLIDLGPELKWEDGRPFTGLKWS